MVPRKQTSWRMSHAGKKILEKTADVMGVSQAAVIERAIREIAERHNVDVQRIVAETTPGVR